MCCLYYFQTLDFLRSYLALHNAMATKCLANNILNKYILEVLRLYFKQRYANISNLKYLFSNLHGTLHQPYRYYFIIKLGVYREELT